VLRGDDVGAVDVDVVAILVEVVDSVEWRLVVALVFEVSLEVPTVEKSEDHVVHNSESKAYSAWYC